MRTKKDRSTALNGSILSGVGFAYLPPEISIQTVTIESGFANSISISSPDDDDLPQIEGLDNWDNWE